jgi:hypothetical protein
MSTVDQRRSRALGGRHRRRRFWPARRWQRVLIYVLLAIGYIALMWFYVYPWADRILNRPTV